MSGRGMFGRKSCAAENDRRKAAFSSSRTPFLNSTATLRAKTDYGEICGLSQVSGSMKQAAASLGMTPPMILRLIELPLARPTILAGIKTSAVINVGTDRKSVV